MKLRTLLQFQPSLKEVLWRSWYEAKGLRWFDAINYYAIIGIPKCYICGREKDFFFNFTRLIYYFDMSLKNVVCICDDHGRVTDYDCTTGEPIELPLPKPYWFRWLRNITQWAILRSSYTVRFVWLFGYSLFMWYVAIYPIFWYRELKRRYD